MTLAKLNDCERQTYPHHELKRSPKLRNRWCIFLCFHHILPRDLHRFVPLKVCSVQNIPPLCKMNVIFTKVSFCFSALPTFNQAEVDEDIEGVKDWIDKKKDEL